MDKPANIRPFLRWAGSKRKFLKHLLPFIPLRLEKYFEPFLGGGALFFYLGPPKAELSDTCLPLIETYKAVKMNHELVLKLVMPLKPNRENFERLKKLDLDCRFARAAQFIFLNKSCWNGLYRVNSDGIFNVPFGKPKTDFVLDEDNFRRCANQLRRKYISIRCQDFESIEERVSENDFVFFDPPYVTSHNMNGFADWNERIFSWADQVRLASFAKRLVSRKANVLITNAAHADVRQLYPSFQMTEFVRYSSLASDVLKRRPTAEAIFYGGPAYAHFTAPSLIRTGWHAGDCGVT